MRFIKLFRGAVAPSPVVYTRPVDVPRERVHHLLVEARNQLTRVGWTTGWGLAIGDATCIIGAIGLALGLERLPEARTSVEAFACARALGFADISDALAWNDRQMALSMIFERLDAGIRSTAPTPVDPFVTHITTKAPEPELVQV